MQILLTTDKFKYFKLSTVQIETKKSLSETDFMPWWKQSNACVLL